MLKIKGLIVIFLIYFIIINSNILSVTTKQLRAIFDDEDPWNGRWFPYSPNDRIDKNPSVSVTSKKDLYDPNHGVVMGVRDKSCDDGKTRLQVDWDMNPINYTCFENKRFYRARSDIKPLHSIDYIPKTYSAIHRCMNSTIEYEDIIPTFGIHRPLWAKYGEYLFLPRQRWLHNLEHGSVVMLYHPCADKNEVNLLRKLVNKCLYRHVITPYNLLSAERPLALITWGNRLEMSKVAPEIVLNFIKSHALKGPEHTARDGQYDLLLEQHANIVSDINDQYLCKVFDVIE